MLEKLFKLKENNTTVKTEIVAGLTTFLTIAYIIALQPNILTNYGEGGQKLWNSVFLATCIASAIAMTAMALLANKPFCLGPGMGINNFFALVVANLIAMTGMQYVEAFQSVMCIVLFEGIVFLLLSLFNIREKIVDSIPLGVRLGIAPAIGLMLMNIGFGSNVYIADENYNQFFIMRDFFGALTAKRAKELMGSAYPTMVLSVITLFVGLFVIVILAGKKIRASVIIGILVASVVNWIGQAVFLHQNPFAALETASFVPAFGDLVETTLFKFNFKGLTSLGIFTVITLVITFCIIDMFDTIGTLVGTAARAGMLDKDGNMPQMKEALLSDAIGTVSGSLIGTSTITTFIESASGVEAGGRTGLTAITTGFMFLLCIFLAPVAAIIPAAATSSALVYVGILMILSLKDLDFSDSAVLVPVAIMLISMPISGSIGHAIGIGIISYSVLKLCTGKAKEVHIVTYILSILFLLKFFLAI